MVRYGAALAAASAVLISAVPAVAQDYDQTWTGFYAGASVGGVWGNTSNRLRLERGNGAVVIPPADIASLNALVTDDHDNNGGFAGAIEAGYNYQMGAFLVGLETDFVFLDVDESTSKTFQSTLPLAAPLRYTLEQKVSSDWVWTLRPRLGYVSGPWMFFGSAGIGVSDVKLRSRYADSAGRTAQMSDSATKTGFAGGLGAAYAFSPQWSVKGEWLYMDFGKVSASAPTTNGFAVITGEGKVKANAFRVALDYKF